MKKGERRRKRGTKGGRGRESAPLWYNGDVRRLVLLAEHVVEHLGGLSGGNHGDGGVGRVGSGVRVGVAMSPRLLLAFPVSVSMVVV